MGCVLILLILGTPVALLLVPTSALAKWFALAGSACFLGFSWFLVLSDPEIEPPPCHLVLVVDL